jgi:hypothetical protein
MYLGSMLVAAVAFTAVVYSMLQAIAAGVGESVGRIGDVLAELLISVLEAIVAVAWLLKVWRQLQEWFGGGFA